MEGKWGGKRTSSGRKPIDDPKSIRKLYRFSNAEMELIKKALLFYPNVNEAEFVRDACISKARRIIAQAEGQNS